MPSAFEDMLNTLLTKGSIRPDDVPKYVDNYYFFQDQIRRIEAQHKGQWVAALKPNIYAQTTLRQLERQMDAFPDGNYAYIEKIE
jgi:hypothetical protein